MSNEVDELIRDIESFPITVVSGPPVNLDAPLAQHLLAAGYRKPWVITTAAERAILLPGTICVDKDGNAWKRGTGSWVSTGSDTWPLYDEDDLELTVLHEGTQP